MDHAPPKSKLTEAEAERLIARYTPLVQSIAKTLLKRMPANVDGDDLLQDGYVGLMVAILQAAKVGAGAQFDSYLSQRVRGAMIDGLRRTDPASAGVRHNMRRVESAIHELGQRFGRMPTELEVADFMSMPLSAYQSLLASAHGYTLLSLEDFDDTDSDSDRNFIDWCANTNSDPLAALQRKALRRTLLMAISDLSSQEEQVMISYYVHEMKMKEVGSLLRVTEGRVSQIHAQAIAKLRAALLNDKNRQPLLAPRWRQS